MHDVRMAGSKHITGKVLVFFFFLGGSRVCAVLPRATPCIRPWFISVLTHGAGLEPPREVTRNLGFLAVFSQRLELSLFVTKKSSTSGLLGHKLARYSSRARKLGPHQCLTRKCVYVAFLLEPRVLYISCRGN